MARRFFVVYLHAILSLVFLTSTGCVKPNSEGYRSIYSHLKKSYPKSSCNEKAQSPFFIVFLVDACHLDYSDNRSFFKTVAKHPSNGNKNGSVGHAWIYLQGIIDGEDVFLEGGHSGELGIVQPKYFEGLINYFEYGYANPSERQKKCPRYEPNPIKYLWESQHDGFFQWGAGNHQPTFAAKVDLTQKQFFQILYFVQSYCFSDYSLIGNQCSSFVAQIASLAGLDLECEVTIAISPSIYMAGQNLRLWTDPGYSQLTVSSPDILECSLMRAVREGRAECALEWYQKTHRVLTAKKIANLWENIKLFPERFFRYLQMQSQ